MPYALISNGRVHQIFPQDPMLGDDLDVRDVSRVKGIAENWTVSSDGKFAAPALPDGQTLDPVPFAVTSAQAKIQLKRAGFLKAAREAVDALDDEEIQIWFNEARTWQRNNAHVNEIAAALGISSDETDELFREAAKIDA
jgi:hypothetical protein